MAKRIVVGRKLLVASLGVATLSYVACTTSPSSGNLMFPDGDAAADGPVTSGNLMPPPPPDGAADAKPDAPVTSGNLMPPPPPDAGDAGDAGDSSSDAGRD